MSKSCLQTSPFLCEMVDMIEIIVLALPLTALRFFSSTRISSLANLDKRLLDVLRVIRSKEWTYGHSSTHSHLLTSYAKDRGYPSPWGDPQVLPAFGGADADVTWKALGVP